MPWKPLDKTFSNANCDFLPSFCIRFVEEWNALLMEFMMIDAKMQSLNLIVGHFDKETMP